MSKEIISFIDFTNMSDEEKYKLLNSKDYEIERLNNIIDKKEQFLGDNIKRLEREVVKRDNIINELEKYGKQRFNEYAEWKEECKYLCYINGITEMLDKLHELKGSDK